jgi:ribosomal protein S18 acetylase RimI-like enzyme
MKEDYSFRQAAESDFGQIWPIILQAKAQMARLQVKPQWDETYPTQEGIMKDIRNGVAYVLCMKGDDDGVSDGDVIAYGAVVFTGEPTYDHIDGAWLTADDAKYSVVHRLAVTEKLKNRGIATAYVREAERLTAEKGVRSVRIDTKYENPYMLKILERLGYTYCGIIDLIRVPETRKAFEKILF